MDFGRYFCLLDYQMCLAVFLGYTHVPHWKHTIGRGTKSHMVIAGKKKVSKKFWATTKLSPGIRWNEKILGNVKAVQVRRMMVDDAPRIQLP